jgi:tRNA G18 (ribose-2'-O)-methylase SpoU
MKTKDKNMITEELLAAFEEGKTNAEETALVLEYLATDESLQEEFILSHRFDRQFIGLCTKLASSHRIYDHVNQKGEKNDTGNQIVPIADDKRFFFKNPVHTI